MCFNSKPTIPTQVTQPTPPPVAAPLAPESPVDTPEASRARATARRRLRIDLASPGATGSGLSIPQ